MTLAASASSANRLTSSSSVPPADATASRGVTDAVGLDVEDQPVAVGHLLDAGVLDRVRDLADRREDRVDRDHADRVAGLLVLVGHAVPDAALDGHLHLQVRALAERRDVQVGVQDLDARGRRDVTGGDLARGPWPSGTRWWARRARERTTSSLRFRMMSVTSSVTFGIGRELVQHAVDPDRRDRGAGDGRQQRATERVPDRVAETGLERLDRELRAGGREDFFGDLGSGDDEQLYCLLRRGINHCYPACYVPGRRRGAGCRRVSDAAALARPAAVVRHRRHVLDARDLEARGRERADRGLAARTRALHEHVHLLQAVLLRLASAAFSAASCAANGVDLREPLKPTLPALAQQSVLPCRSVMVTIVLLNVDLMCACPWDDVLLLAALRAFFALGFAIVSSPSAPTSSCAFFLPATVFFGPLRVRAFVCVRWPRTGRLRRWRIPW